MTISSILDRGVSGMLASQFGVETASQNAANVATEGYSRRIVTLEPVGPRPLGGVRATGSRRVVDAMLERRLLGARSFAGEASARAGTLSVLDNVFAAGPGSIGTAVDSFQLALADFAANPHELGARSVVLERAGELSRAFNNAADELATARSDVNARIVDSVRQVNGKLHEIADLGQQIAKHENATGQEASDLRDRRDQLVRQIADFVPIKVVADANGAVSVRLAGSLSLVSPDGKVSELQTIADPGSGDVQIYRTTAGATADVTAMLTTGRIGGYVTARDGALAESQADLDLLAYDTVAGYNAVHTVGVGLDGATGRNLFAPAASATGAAGAMAVSADVLGQPSALAAATSAASLPGDNRNALELQALTDSNLASAGTATFNEAYAAIVASAGSAAQSAISLEEHASAVADQVASVRNSLSGVSTDEEMISLMRFQRAYQASLKVIQTADQMLEELINLKR